VDLLVILAIRADSFDPLATALKRASDAAEKEGAPQRTALDPETFPLLPLSATAYRDVIRLPAQVAQKTERDIFEPALVDHLVETSAGADALPLLAMTLEQLYAEYGLHERINRGDYAALYGTDADAAGPVRRALAAAYRMAGAAGTDETLNRLLIPGLATWDQAAGETGAAKRRVALRASLLDGDANQALLADALASPQVRLLTRGNAEAGPRRLRWRMRRCCACSRSRAGSRSFRGCSSFATRSNARLRCGTMPRPDSRRRKRRQMVVMWTCCRRTSTQPSPRGAARGSKQR
jgi:hypothetical protein